VKAVIDTNVIVSAMLSPRGAPASIWEALVEAKLTCCVDQRILEEYQTVLRRPRFALDERDVAEVLDFLGLVAEPVRTTPLVTSLPDPKDAPFLEVALAGAADAIITGNIRHFPARVCHPIRVLTPAAALAML
jgi:putative PIN family toxin of toxin-antitoxin system